jgi:CubicO group peptidase (beta-lactamase class C family)
MKDRVESLLDESIHKKVFTGASYAIKKDSRLTVGSVGAIGETDRLVNERTLFDMASCTKLFTTIAFLRMMEEGKLALTDTVDRYLPGWSGGLTGRITMFELLTHTSMLPAHLPLYQMSRDREGAIEILKQLLPRKSTGVEYSCLGYIILGFILEEVTGLPLDQVIDHYVTHPLGMTNTGYCPEKKLQDNIMPSEYCTWRNRRIVGEVHDENACHMGGISGNAGIFSDISDMCLLAEAMLGNKADNKVGLLNEKTIKIMTTNYTKDYQENRGLGWCIKNTPDLTAGEYFSEKSFGHTGFTGTSIWIDPESECYAILLTNRVYYTREISEIRHVRQVFHNLAMLY